VPNQLCVVAHRSDPDRPRLAADGLLVCPGCAHRITTQLRDLPALWDALAEAMATPWRETTVDLVWALSIPEKALPFQPDMADHRTEIDSVAMSLARMVAEDMDAAWPPYGIYDVAPWLGLRLDFILAQPWVAEFSDQLTDLVRTAHGYLEPRHVRKLPCGPCREHLHGPALPGEPHPIACPGVLIARIGDDVEDRTDPTCDWCGAVVSIDHAAALKRGMSELLSTVEVADATGVPAGTVRRWAHLGRLRRQGTDSSGRTLYMLEHVQALADERDTVTAKSA
jgi:hypothetical protein